MKTAATMLSGAHISELLREHSARNIELINSLQHKGVDLTKVYPVEHHFWAPTQSSAEALRTELKRRGYTVMTINPIVEDDQSTTWNVEAEMTRTLHQAADPTLTKELVQLGATFDALYDGWGASI